MKTVAAPIYFGLLQSTDTTIPTDTKKEKVSKPLKGFFSRRADVGRTGHHDDCGRPNFGLLQSTKTIIPTPITKKEKKSNLEEDLLAGGTEDCGCPSLDGYKVHKP